LAGKNNKNLSMITGHPQWYMDAVIYQLHVKTFFDSNDDGIGDLKGLESRLDYLQELGVTAIWLLPFYPSPQKDDGYDISDYYRINPQYGTMRDFRSLLKSAHERNLRVITELVINHTSDQHPWFQKSRRAKPGSSWRNFYVWSDDPSLYSEARIIFQDFENSNWTWDPLAQAYYWHRFYAHQPDLNFDNPRVKKEILKVLDFWFGMGVDGLRLDAVPYLFEREGTNCENLPETHDFLKELRAHVDSAFSEKMLLAEANQWPEDAVAYFGEGDECHMAFNFPIMPRIFMSIKMEDRFPLVDILDQTPSLPDNCQWAMFLRNHDELTLEMVSDEERDYMYRVYARDTRARINLGIRRRLAPLLEKNRRKLELINFLLLCLPGTPIVYYGDEIGMGDNYFLGDRDGVRTPMQWSPDRNAGFSRANPQTLFLPVITDPNYHYEVVNVENEEKNSSSLLWWMRRSISIRKNFKAFSRGDIRIVTSDNPKVISFSRNTGEESLLVVANLSHFTQIVNLNLYDYKDHSPTELSGGTVFPQIKDEPYLLTMGSNDYYIFLLEHEKEDAKVEREGVTPEISTLSPWRDFLSGREKGDLEERVLPGYLNKCRWFGSKSRKIRKLKISNYVRIQLAKAYIHLCLLKVNYVFGPSEFFILPLSFASGEKEHALRTDSPESIIAGLSLHDEKGVLFDSVYDTLFHRFMKRFLSRRRRLRGKDCSLVSSPSRSFRKIAGSEELPSRVLKAQQSNSSILYEDRLFLKVFRKVEEGVNPDCEISNYLSRKGSFPNIPNFAGTVDLTLEDGSAFSIAIAQSYCSNEGEMWQYSLDAIDRCFDQMLSEKDSLKGLVKEPEALMWKVEQLPGELKDSLEGFFIEMTGLLGKRTAQMHGVLASGGEREPDFSVEPFSKLYQRSLYQNSRSLVKKNFQYLREGMDRLEPDTREKADRVLGLEKKILDSFRIITREKINSSKIRIHGDLHLGQVLFTGKDFVFIDFEGEPDRPIGERRIKRSPFRDVAGMIRSFHYAAYTALLKKIAYRPEDSEVLTPWADIIYYTLSGVFLKAYFEESHGMSYISEDMEQMKMLVEHFLLEKAVYELGYELGNRPDWVDIPLKGILSIVEEK
jgi:maltose alpha-D-glucosyltransferase/alpha-amylase